MLFTPYPNVENSQSNRVFAIGAVGVESVDFIVGLSVSLKSRQQVYLTTVRVSDGSISFILQKRPYGSPDASLTKLCYCEGKMYDGINKLRLESLSDDFIGGEIYFTKPASAVSEFRKLDWQISPMLVNTQTAENAPATLSLNGVRYTLRGYVDIKLNPLFRKSGSTYVVDCDLYNAQSTYLTAGQTTPVYAINGILPDDLGRLSLAITYNGTAVTLAKNACCIQLYYDTVTCDANNRIDEALSPAYPPGGFDATVYYKAPLDIMYIVLNGSWVRDANILKTTIYEPYAATQIGLYSVNPMHNIQAPV